MKVPLSWLREYVDVDVSPKELADRLTFAGLEVEGIHTIGGEYLNVVVAEVLAIEPHPDADRLTVCRVSNGKTERRVVCGAANFQVGDKVPLAEVGATLPNGMKVTRAKVRGVESQGMLCAEDELGLSDDHSGLMILSRSLAAGTPFAEVAGPPETVLEMEITPNRPDCLSIIGVAREVAALYGKKLRLPSVSLPENGVPVEQMTSVIVEDAEGCPRYTARVLTGIAIAPSPRWMQQRLTWAGVRPISNVVDITNYIMLECGQPLHAFDYELLNERRIVVRRARPGEKLSTLDGIARDITPEMLMIADGTRPVAMAGIMGGAGSEINATTKTVLLESAYFKPQDIRKTSKRLGLSTESSYRFERGIDIGSVEWTSRRAAALMVAHAGATACRGVIDVFPRKPVPPRIRMRFDRARDLLGVTLSNDAMAAILESLELKVTARNERWCEAEIPAFRVDLEQEADLIEEVARIHGLDNVPTPTPSATLVADADDRQVRAVMICRENLAGLGLLEIMNYSFLSERLLNLAGDGELERRILLPNPISADHTVLRDSLLPQMIETLGRNRARQAKEAALFEIGRVFFKDASGQYAEEERLCVGLLGPVGRFSMQKTQPIQPDEMFQWVKGILEALCLAHHVPEISQGALRRLAIELPPVQCRCFDEGKGAAVLIAGEACGVMGLVNAAIRAEWRLAEPVGVLEIRLEPLLRQTLRAARAKAVAAYPGVDRDVALIVGDGVTHQDVLSVIWKAAPAELTGVRLFDIYRGEGLGETRKSMAYSLTYRSMERTLTDDEANRYHDRVKSALRRELGAEIRE